ncbi:MAG TPA: DEAD/DEAH box helicase [Acholeplasmataceae bacterium]|nr:DEAD/DEAH box helicase [Acholeplasmataceae bacterium]
MTIEQIIKELKFASLTPIQTEVMKNFNKNQHIVGLAPTGTGKTHAYLIPIIANIDLNINSLQAIVLVPTNELVNQVLKMFHETNSTIRVKAYDAKTDKKRENKWLENNQPQLVISTPSKLIEFSKDNLLQIHKTKYFVLDEADMMFDFAFLSEIDQILDRMIKPKNLLFSATISENMKPFINKYFGNHIYIDTTKEHELKIEYMLFQTRIKNRLEMLLEIVANLNPYMALIFVSKNENQEEVYNALRNKGLKVGMMSSKLSANQRKNMIKDISDLKYQYVVVSDLAARGLDFDISHVINYDLPYQLEFFKHRSGRTGRMEKEGIVITIADDRDSRKIQRITEMGISFNRYNIAKSGFVKAISKDNKLLKVEVEAIKKIPKPKKVKPNSRKKNKEKIVEAKRKARKKLYDKTR